MSGAPVRIPAPVVRRAGARGLVRPVVPLLAGLALIAGSAAWAQPAKPSPAAAPASAAIPAAPVDTAASASVTPAAADTAASGPPADPAASGMPAAPAAAGLSADAAASALPAAASGLAVDPTAAAAAASDAASDVTAEPASGGASGPASGAASGIAGEGAASGVPSARAASAAAAAEGTASAAVRPMPPGVQGPRAFGHVLGDVLTQRLPLPAGVDAPAVVALPPAGRTGRWFERWPPQLETDDEGRHWLRLDYQVVNVPREPLVAALPAVSIAIGSGALDVPAWPVGLGPLTVAADRLGALPMWREDRPLPPQETPAMTRRLHNAVLSFAAVLLAWAGWWAWRESRAERELPFAQALRVLQRADPDDPEAWRALHRAIDATAGRVVHAASLPQLLQEQPALQPLQDKLEAFYRASAERFFDGRAGDAGAFPLRDLARALRRIERAQQA